VDLRQKLRIPNSPEFTVIISGPRKTRAHIKRLKLRDKMICPYNEGEQYVKHKNYVCRIMEHNRNDMTKHITTRGGIWPTKNI